MYAVDPLGFHLEDASCRRCKETTFPRFPKCSLMFTTRLDVCLLIASATIKKKRERKRGRNITWPDSTVIPLSFGIVAKGGRGGLTRDGDGVGLYT